MGIYLFNTSDIIRVHSGGVVGIPKGAEVR